MRKTNKKNFKKTLSKFTTGVTVIFAENNGEIHGKTVNSFNSFTKIYEYFVTYGFTIFCKIFNFILR